MSKKLKIVLVVSIFLVLAVIGLAYFGRGNNKNETVVSEETQTSDDIYAPNTTAYPDETSTTEELGAADETNASATTSISPTTSASPSASKTSSALAVASATKASGATADQSRYIKINPPAKTITPYPDSGPLDWTRQNSSYLVAPTAEFIKKDFCELTKISDSWSSPIEKTFCELARFTNKQILDPINSLLCNIQAAAISLNFSDNVSSELVGGECRLTDR